MRMDKYRGNKRVEWDVELEMEKVIVVKTINTAIFAKDWVTLWRIGMQSCCDWRLNLV
jgi:hypothetical protein